ncbi:MAG: hypothetical protein NZO16_04260 [Deltaproteobacteria bacterium]|nr:hypothetical protein [Deltaproteobacteria bacterium]
MLLVTMPHKNPSNKPESGIESFEHHINKIVESRPPDEQVKLLITTSEISEDELNHLKTIWKTRLKEFDIELYVEHKGNVKNFSLCAKLTVADLDILVHVVRQIPPENFMKGLHGWQVRDWLNNMPIDSHIFILVEDNRQQPSLKN